jgi:hypothetical protein
MILWSQSPLSRTPFGNFDPEMLRHAFPDRFIPFKEHFVADLSVSRNAAIASHHRHEARRVLRHLRVEVCTRPQEFLDDWVRLYQFLIVRHGSVGLSAWLALVALFGICRYAAKEYTGCHAERDWNTRSPVGTNSIMQTLLAGEIPMDRKHELGSKAI